MISLLMNAFLERGKGFVKVRTELIWMLEVTGSTDLILAVAITSRWTPCHLV